MIRRICHLHEAAGVGHGIALGNQLLGGPLLLFEEDSPAQKPFALVPENDLLRCVPGVGMLESTA